MKKNGMNNNEGSSQLLVLIPLQSNSQLSLYVKRLIQMLEKSNCSERDAERHRQEIKDKK